MSDDAAAKVADIQSTAAGDAADVEPSDQQHDQPRNTAQHPAQELHAAAGFAEDPANNKDQEERNEGTAVNTAAAAAAAEESMQEAASANEATGEAQATYEPYAEGASNEEAAYGEGYNAEDQPGEAGADVAPEVTYHISSPGGVAPASDATHTKLAMHDEIPNFAGFSQMGRIAFHDYIAGGWSVLVTFARAFDPVSMTEIGRLAKLRDNFEARSINVLGVLPESVLMVSSYLQDVAKIEQTKIDFPVLADPDGTVLRRLGAWDEQSSVGVSCVFVMGPFKKILYRLVCQQDVGRNFYEVLRIIDALAVNAEVQCATPANWTFGEEVT
eukprot:INCI17306.1.p1 GENE.INCI17306.1~~INCI17306.1.p1  ORF type:complete len:329 (-),score=71.53 INCI17306.1:1267-2253(-)